MRILLAEDEAAIAEHVCNTLAAAGYLVTACATGPEAWEAGSTADFDAIVLDLGLPGLDGLTLLKRWRAEGMNVPVLVLTARGSWMERVDGFDSGADDYLPKPFRAEELLARLRALLRRANGAAATARKTGRLVIDGNRMAVFLDGAAIEVTPSEYRALWQLAGSPGVPIPAHKLAAAAIGREDDHAGNAVEVMINRLRKKIGPDIILTRRGFGYYLAGGAA